MARRWIWLLAIGAVIALLDQGTKFLAIKHLTPGLAQAHLDRPGPMPWSTVEETVAGMSLTEQIGAFYGGVESPCPPGCRTLQVIEGLWQWRYVQNPGAAWGLLSSAHDKIRVPFFLIVPVAAMLFIFAFVRKLEDHQILPILAMSLVFGGAIGNFIDRLHLSYVIDFIDWYVGTAHWPTFNVADAAISTGVGLLGVEWVRDWLRARETGRSQQETPA